MGIPETIPSLAERVAREGWTTIAVSASPIVRATPGRYNPHGGFGRGFDTFVEDCVWRTTECVNEAALDRLEAVEEPFFLYLHYMDPHGPFHPPESWERRFAGEGEGLPDWALRGDPNPIADAIYRDRVEPDVPPGALEHLVGYTVQVILATNQCATLAR